MVVLFEIENKGPTWIGSNPNLIIIIGIIPTDKPREYTWTSLFLTHMPRLTLLHPAA
jgi:hypothetical protein